MSKIRSLFENIVFTAIILVLFQTVIEDIALVLSWSSALQQTLVVLGFFFDMFFSAEFIIRFVIAGQKRKIGHYLWVQRGWIDFLAGIPLALFNSGPAFFALLTGGVVLAGIGGMLNVLKIIKVIRIARVLRLLRILKIFQKIKNTESTMVQRHIAVISTITVSTVVFVLLGIAVVIALAGPSISEEALYQKQALIAGEHVAMLLQNEDYASVKRFAESNEHILLVENKGLPVYSKFGQEYFNNFYLPSDYFYVENGVAGIFMDLKPLIANQAIQSLSYFVVITGIILVFLFIYSPHFAITVTDPIHVMRRGMSESGYNLEVKIFERYKNDDIYALAEQYNHKFLPMKAREMETDDTEQDSALSMDDFQDLIT